MRNLLTTSALIGSIALLGACSPSSEDAAAPAEDTAAMDTAATPAADAAQASAVMNANDATVEQLSTVDGVTPELAQAIVAGQPYASVVAFNQVLTGALSAEQAEAVRARVFVPVNLNSASEEEIRLIPGMTDRMVHEFEEYRPYSDMAVFDREIGKYVDAAEVARLRSYVTL